MIGQTAVQTRTELLAELRQIRTRLEQIAAVLLGEQSREELWPVWDCGHRHISRGEAIRCKAQEAALQLPPE